MQGKEIGNYLADTLEKLYASLNSLRCKEAIM